MKKIVVTVLAVLILGGAGGYAYLKRNGKSPDKTSPDVSEAVVQRGALISTIATTGKVVSNLDIEIKCKSSGQVIKIPYDVSDSVKKGDLLVELDPIDESRQVKKAQVQLKDSEARLAKAQQNLMVAGKTLEKDRAKCEATLLAAEAKAKDTRAKAERGKRLRDEGNLGQQDYETLETAAVSVTADLKNAQIRREELDVEEMGLELKRQEIRSAEAAVEGDKVALEIAQQRLADTKVVAPIDGVISERRVSIGQIIASGINNVGGGTSMLTLSDMSHVYILASVDESDIGRVNVGQSAMITVDSFPEERFMGKVERMGTMGTVVSNVVVFDVKIEVTSENKNFLRQEMTASINVVVASKDDALYVPADAVSHKGRQSFATVKNGLTEEKREVKTGITDGVSVEVLDGLKEGEKVVALKGSTDARWNRQGGGDRGGPRPGMGMMMGMGRRP